MKSQKGLLQQSSWTSLNSERMSVNVTGMNSITYSWATAYPQEGIQSWFKDLCDIEPITSQIKCFTVSYLRIQFLIFFFISASNHYILLWPYQQLNNPFYPGIIISQVELTCSRVLCKCFKSVREEKHRICGGKNTCTWSWYTQPWWAGRSRGPWGARDPGASRQGKAPGTGSTGGSVGALSTGREGRWHACSPGNPRDVMTADPHGDSFPKRKYFSFYKMLSEQLAVFGLHCLSHTYILWYWRALLSQVSANASSCCLVVFLLQSCCFLLACSKQSSS